MELLTIGAFARAAGLTQKALRLYDGLGLLSPAAVDPDSGYRLYDPEQLPSARLIAELRRIDMPLAEIQIVAALPPNRAAGAVADYWRRVSADTAERARLADLLVHNLAGRGTSMTDTIDFRFATVCESGARTPNQDIAYAGSTLLAVADGGGGTAGAAASRAAVDALRALDPAGHSAADLLGLLAGAVSSADRAVRDLADGDQQPISTLTGLLRSGSRLALMHIGDTRAYLLRNGDLVQLTQDHTWVQTQVDAGVLDIAAARAHPRRALIVRALGAGGPEVEADLGLRTALTGDRYLLCSDGLSAVVEPAALRTALRDGGEPESTVRALVALAEAAGAPDNIACVVADVVAV